MAERKSKQFPFRTLGFQLRSLREKLNESIPDVSGAVEIEPEVLLGIEEGTKLPSEDILLLLISHFNLQNEEAMNLWRLAGYDKLDETSTVSKQDNLTQQQSAVFILPIDSRVVYTDMVQVTVNNFGIVVNFQQANSQANSQSLTVARVGMSKEHAKNLISILQKVVSDETPKSAKSESKTNQKPENNKKEK